MIAVEAKHSSSADSPGPDCVPFLNWDESRLETDNDKTVIFRSLVATLKLQPSLPDSLELKAVKLLKFMHPQSEPSADAFLSSLGRPTDESLTNFVQLISVLFTSTSQVITTAAMKMLDNLIMWLGRNKWKKMSEDTAEFIRLA
ncbi:hypothetical protein BLNAU_23608 [Blattamonas nauphoetae]|uniref:Uncharacterized protein n=1 Tax=Blattamonas nauphoetae TaxID=2049346 RepID=A0ABQ9WPS8_9EUKA|nr:hypothetical protein BLNAU_23608 [Blattamonas nauphoetae]